MRILLSILFLCTAVLLACSPKTTEVMEETESSETTSTESTSDSDMPKADIGEGKVIFLKKCGRCHDLVTVEDYSKEQWDKILPDMSKKAKLTELETIQLAKYIYWELEN